MDVDYILKRDCAFLSTKTHHDEVGSGTEVLLPADLGNKAQTYIACRGGKGWGRVVGLGCR